ncbi:hypothetical protein FCL54_08930 [Pseudalkalibacillus caeni]|uniref:Uncharacterized protein n=1 Tax=Exobacillus caeni TaxID=2574798 RepID=A0A5R9F6B8_9BACL|nr:hypothetical protein FCL54_08930 [Pseudalkalibacillus caeni]
MIFRFFLLLIGFGLSVAGGVTMILHLNMIIIGHSFRDYLLFVSQSPEFIVFASGVFIISSSIYWPHR